MNLSTLRVSAGKIIHATTAENLRPHRESKAGTRVIDIKKHLQQSKVTTFW